VPLAKVSIDPVVQFGSPVFVQPHAHAALPFCVFATYSSCVGHAVVGQFVGGFSAYATGDQPAGTSGGWQ
jgi:hypothetical protein